MISFYIPVFVYLTGCLIFLLINGNGIVLCHFFLLGNNCDNY